MTFPTQFSSQAVSLGDSNILHPVYTFTVNLDRLLSEKIGPNTNQVAPTVLHPDAYNQSPDNGRLNMANHQTGNSSWIPGFLLGENVVVNDNGTITAYGQKAVYLKKAFADSASPLLTLTSYKPLVTSIPQTYVAIGSGGSIGGGTGIFADNGTPFV